MDGLRILNYLLIEQLMKTIVIIIIYKIVICFICLALVSLKYTSKHLSRSVDNPGVILHNAINIDEKLDMLQIIILKIILFALYITHFCRHFSHFMVNNINI